MFEEYSSYIISYCISAHKRIVYSFITPQSGLIKVVSKHFDDRIKMLTTQSVALLGSFAFTLSLLTFGSRFIVERFGLFPPDPLGDPTSFKNTLHYAWGSSSASKGGLFSATMSQKIANGDFGDIKEYLAPIGFAVVLGLGAVFSFFVFGKSKSESSCIQRVNFTNISYSRFLSRKTSSRPGRMERVHAH